MIGLVAEQKLNSLKEEEEQARRRLESLGSSQLRETSEPAVVDVYQHTRYETSEDPFIDFWSIFFLNLIIRRAWSFGGAC